MSKLWTSIQQRTWGFKVSAVATQATALPSLALDDTLEYYVKDKIIYEA